MHMNKNAFQWDPYRPLVTRISQHALWRGVSASQGVSASGERVCIPACIEADTPPDRMTDRCKITTFANFVCGREQA